MGYETVGELMPLEGDGVVDDGGELFLVVGDEDESLVRTLAEGLDDIIHQTAVVVVKSVKGLVENQQVGVFDKGSG